MTYILKNDFNLEYPYRFQYKHDCEDREFGVIKGLEQFKKTLKFVTSEKPPKKQKRNDYESSNSRK